MFQLISAMIQRVSVYFIYYDILSFCCSFAVTAYCRAMLLQPTKPTPTHTHFVSCSMVFAISWSLGANFCRLLYKSGTTVAKTCNSREKSFEDPFTPWHYVRSTHPISLQGLNFAAHIVVSNLAFQSLYRTKLQTSCEYARNSFMEMIRHC